MSRSDAAKNRERVVATASEMFRAEGYDGIGIAGLMQAAGLTNGAFYKQFDSKEALIAEATAEALARNAEAWQAVLDSAQGDPLAAVSEWYLSAPHIAHREKGCAYAALASEAPRHDARVGRAFEDGLRHTLSLISGAADGDDTMAIRLLSRLIGALMLARAVRDPELAASIVAANRAPEAPRGS
ncbi:TetR/AcrR family transcriptional regulator [Salipiger sp. P9]|uniref:TetR/AcrR family transcriptional regulator n=1 Tax=Salipiger pentaromativorans TaxID=2943193 RepID=UPI00215897CE|nr:TetR/AcrR family transcriptional regulator [Salipiger pentaromativorans]MCR8549811.1 TetR/AcrR family transcriptional regulator [Salipiger pentaromativorans]